MSAMLTCYNICFVFNIVNNNSKECGAKLEVKLKDLYPQKRTLWK